MKKSEEDLLFDKADALMASRDFEGALEIYNRISSEYLDNSPLMAQAMALYALGRDDEASHVYNDFAARYPFDDHMKTEYASFTNDPKIVLIRAAERHKTSQALVTSINSLITYLDKGVRPSDEPEITRTLAVLKRESPRVLNELRSVLTGTVAGAGGNLIATLISKFFS